MSVGAIPQDPRLVGTEQASGQPKQVEATGEAGRGRLEFDDRQAVRLLGEISNTLEEILVLLQRLA